MISVVAKQCKEKLKKMSLRLVQGRKLKEMKSIISLSVKIKSDQMKSEISFEIMFVTRFTWKGTYQTE